MFTLGKVVACQLAVIGAFYLGLLNPEPRARQRWIGLTMTVLQGGLLIFLVSLKDVTVNLSTLLTTTSAGILAAYGLGLFVCSFLTTVDEAPETKR